MRSFTSYCKERNIQKKMPTYAFDFVLFCFNFTAVHQNQTEPFWKKSYAECINLISMKFNVVSYCLNIEYVKKRMYINIVVQVCFC